MKRELEDAERLIQELRTLVSRCGWAGNDPDLVVDGVVSVLMRHLATGRPLSEIVDETLSLPCFSMVGDMDERLILNTLIFLYSRELMERSRDLLSRMATELVAGELETAEVEATRLEAARAEATELEFAKVEAATSFLGRVICSLRKAESDYPPIPLERRGQPLFGVSLVLAFEYPNDFVNAINAGFADFPLLVPDRGASALGLGAYVTSQMHFTLINVGLNLRRSEADRLFTALKPPLRRLIRTDFAARRAVETMYQEPKVSRIFRVMRDGSLILLGSGARFLQAFCDLRQAVSPVISRLSSASSAAYNIWMHTVYARPAQPFTAAQVAILAGGANGLQQGLIADERIDLQEARLAIMMFEDKKAILPPVELSVYHLVEDDWL